MSDIYVLSAYIILAVDMVLSLGAVYFAYRLTRITGLFRAWALMIVAVAIVAYDVIASFFGFLMLSVTTVTTLEAALEALGPLKYTADVAPGTLLCMVLFACMYEMHGIMRAFVKVDRPA